MVEKFTRVSETSSTMIVLVISNEKIVSYDELENQQ